MDLIIGIAIVAGFGFYRTRHMGQSAIVAMSLEPLLGIALIHYAWLENALYPNQYGRLITHAVLPVLAVAAAAIWLGKVLRRRAEKNGSRPRPF